MIYKPRVTIREAINSTNYVLYLKMTSSRAKIPFECKTKQFTDADFYIRETIFQVPA
jgi:hypothetical protein